MVKTFLKLSASTLLALNLSACLEAAPEDATQQTTEHGTLYLGSGAAQDADKMLRELIAFSQGTPSFVAGYRLINNNTGREVTHGIFKLQGALAPDEWAANLQASPKDKDGWSISKLQGEYGETIFNAPIHCTQNCANIPSSKKIAVRVRYDENEKAYLIFFATPADAAKVFNDKDIENRFLKYRLNKQ
ncbi:MAG: hypothetical protein RL217_1568 [Pseudomonadota bacterium]|jgi:hypothetical protein